MEKGCILPKNELARLSNEDNVVLESLARFCKTSKETLLEILRSRNITPKENKDTFLCYGYKKYRASVGGTRAKSYTKKKKLREIREPSPKLKAIQIAIKERLMTIPTSFSATAGPKKSAEKNAELHKHHPYLITLDLKDAFPSIKTRRVYENLKAALWRALDIWTPLLQTTDDTTTTENKRLFLRALTHLCVAEDELPQGAPSSPQILNIVMAKVDSEITRKLPECFGHYRTIYSRYVDDLTISFDKYPTKDVLEEKFDTYCRNIQKAQSDPNTLTNIMNQFQNDTFIATDNAERTFIQTKIEELKNIIQQAQISQDKKFTFIGQLNKYKGQIQPGTWRIDDLKNELIQIIGQQGRKINSKKIHTRTPQSNTDREINGLVFDKNGKRSLNTKTQGIYKKIFNDLIKLEKNEIAYNHFYQQFFINKNCDENRIKASLKGIYKYIERIYGKDRVPKEFRELYTQAMKKREDYTLRYDDYKQKIVSDKKVENNKLPEDELPF